MWVWSVKTIGSQRMFLLSHINTPPFAPDVTNKDNFKVTEVRKALRRTEGSTTKTAAALRARICHAN
jgi:hypothetical protein